MAAAQSDTFSLLQLHCPQNPAVDVCFVHGVGGGNVSTWTLKEVCWPRDLLPEDIPDARILSFGYDAKILLLGSKVSQNTMLQHAVNLLAALVGNREKSDAVSVRPLTPDLGKIIENRVLRRVPEKAADRIRGAQSRWSGLCTGGSCSVSALQRG